MTIDDLLGVVNTYDPEAKEVLYKAYALAERLHSNQKRESGEPYISHPLAVANILALMNADRDTLCAALLHDTIEDCADEINLITIEKLFNSNVAKLVDGVTKLKKIDYETSQEAKTATIRKIIMSTLSDPRILLIKLADKLHNMRTLEYKKSHLKQRETGLETLDIFSPLAHSIGAYYLRYELEDLGFKFSMPDQYNDIYNKRVAIEEYNIPILTEMLETIQSILAAENISSEMKIRIKNVYGIYKRLQSTPRFVDMDDLLGLNVVVDSIRDCYYGLGIVHSKFPHDKGKIKDYMSPITRKPNMYQALHTNIRGPKSKMIQIRFRDPRADVIARHGIGGYWQLYKDKAPLYMKRDITTIPAYSALSSIDSLYSDNTLFVDQIRKEVFTNYIYVDTPSHETIELPIGATVLDFAYKIHSELGNHFSTAVVNDEPVPIDYILRNRDHIRILTNKSNIGPDEAWLNIAQTANAKKKIKESLRKKTTAPYSLS